MKINKYSISALMMIVLLTASAFKKRHLFKTPTPSQKLAFQVLDTTDFYLYCRYQPVAGRVR